MDTLTIVVVLVVLAIFSLTVYMSFSDLNTEIQSDDILSTENKERVDDLHQKFPSFFDGTFMLLLFMFTIAAAISAYFLDTHPIFFFISIFILAAVLFAGSLLGDYYNELAEESDFSSAAVDFPMTQWVFDHFLIVIVMIGFVIIISLYAKYNS